MLRPSSPSSQQPTSPERQLFDPPSNAQNSLVNPPSLSLQQATPLQPSHEDSYLVQFIFAELLEAQRWANTLKEEGYMTSLNFVKKEDLPIHLRVGHFASIAEATQFVDDFKAQGLHGLILKDPR
jgi:hypothetical protein